mmetsp:Transcript_4759/g.15134  ORF Transcript_4759/g.15134 Transcript_4759/m.15134 type:complete len:216 (+) Transcript_4759:442-1089(+)
MAPVARAKVAAAEASVLANLCAAPKAVVPSKQETMKQLKTFPKGTAAVAPYFAAIAADRAGGHCITNTYIAPSNKACAAPTSAIRRSLAMILNASRIVGEFPAADVSALFSGHVNAARMAPSVTNPTDSSNGPDAPRLAAAIDASWPAVMATKASPAYAAPNTSPSAPVVFVRMASPTTQASGAALSKAVPRPPQARPAKRTQSSGDFVDKAEAA